MKDWCRGLAVCLLSITCISCGNGHSVFPAIDRGNTDQIEDMLDEGWDINGLYDPHPLKSGNPKTTALIYACDRNDVSMVQFLLENGADPNRKDERGWPPLIHVLNDDGGRKGVQLNGFPNERVKDIFLLLLDHGADPAIQDSYGRTALEFARQYDNEEAARIMKLAEGRD